MSDRLVPVMPPSTHTVTDDLYARVQELWEHSLAPSTLRTYRKNWRAFSEWCREHGFDPLDIEPPNNCDVLPLFLADYSGTHKFSTLTLFLSAINKVYELSGKRSPCYTHRVHSVMRGIGRLNGTAQSQKDALFPEHIKAIAGELRKSVNEVEYDRTMALLTCGVASGLRNDNLSALETTDILFREQGDGYIIRLRRSKTDQFGHGEETAIGPGNDPETCPLIAMQRWHERVSDGALFRRVYHNGRIGPLPLSHEWISRLIKQCVSLIGLDPRRYSGHSLRAGFCTSAIIAGIPDSIAMQQSKHKTFRHFSSYVRPDAFFKLGLSKKLGL